MLWLLHLALLVVAWAAGDPYLIGAGKGDITGPVVEVPGTVGSRGDALRELPCTLVEVPGALMEFDGTAGSAGGAVVQFADTRLGLAHAVVQLGGAGGDLARIDDVKRQNGHQEQAQ